MQKSGGKWQGWQKAMSLASDVDDTFADDGSGLVEANLKARKYRQIFERIGLPGAAYDRNGTMLYVDAGLSGEAPQRLEADQETGFDASASGTALLMIHDLGRKAWPGEPDHPAARYLVLCIEKPAFERLMSTVWPGLALTGAEFRLVVSLLAGRSLRETAQADGLSYNTKRKQLLSVTAKAGVSGQTDVTRIIGFALTDHLLDRLAFPVPERNDVTFFKDSYGSALRIHDVTVGSQDRLRVFELGPRDGRPCLLYHPMLFPVLPLQGELRALELHNVRLLIPVRPWFCGSERQKSSVPPARKLVAQMAEETATMIQLFGLGRVPVIATVFGAVWASALAHHAPDLVSRLVFVSAPTPYDKSAATRSFVHAMLPFVRETPLIAEAFVRLHARILTSSRLAELGFLRTYKSSAADTATLRQLLAEGWIQRCVRQVLTYSGSGVANELRANVLDWTSALAGVDTEMVFLHGEEDLMSPLALIEPLVERLPQARLEVVENAGQLFYLDRFERILQAV
ncbi:alpha/beta fold hydrolase [Nitratireductor sp. XY-223]|uniref:alpha/beta fold hydrolase n=1 Tax=Nitratireductor sp. XY-223 TaxID=2561926 RepID=UPI0010AAD74C|nr:alpha/beta fold hydrolase [Nitratireductor sp. XY-223]